VIPRSPADKWTAERIGVSEEELTAEMLEAWQINAFRETAQYAKEKSRFYAELFDGYDISAIRTVGDIRALPYTAEEDLAVNEWRFQCVGQADVSRVVTVPTTGTGGSVKRISFSENDQKSALEFIMTGFTTMCEPGDRMLVMMSGDTPGSIGDLVKHAMEPIGVETLTYGAITDIKDAYEKLREYRPNIIVGVPTQTAALALYGRRFGNPEREHIKAVLLSADDVPESVCERLRRLWECSTFRHYGMTEMCIAGGVECLGYSGYHLRACDLMFEIADADEDGFGELVLTTLHREAMPLIRYRTGDIGRITTEKCPCGSVLPRIEHLRGRKNNCAVFHGRKLFLSDIADAVLGDDNAVDFSCTVKGGELKIEVFAMGGEEIDKDGVLARLGADAEIETCTFTEFPHGYDLKKRLEII